MAITLVAALLLGGCASMSEKECRGGDWYSMGLRDGASGRTEDYVSQHAAACQAHGVGRVGGTCSDFCFAGAETEFRRGRSL